MNPITSLKHMTQDNSDPIFSIAKSEFTKLALALTEQKAINQYLLNEESGIELKLYRKIDNKEVIVRIDPGGEIFHRLFDGIYSTIAAAYELEYKREELNNLIEDAKSLITEIDYREELYEKNGKIIFRKIIYPNGASESASTAFAGRLRRFFGTTKKVTFLGDGQKAIGN